MPNVRDKRTSVFGLTPAWAASYRLCEFSLQIGARGLQRLENSCGGDGVRNVCLFHDWPGCIHLLTSVFRRHLFARGAPMIPSHPRVVTNGGLIMGCGLAYHLAHEGWIDVMLLGKAELTSGSTRQAAGQINHSTPSVAVGKCVGYNIDL